MGTKKVAVVIGATGNLGSAIVATLENAGYEVDQLWVSKDHPDASSAKSYMKLPSRIDLAIYAAGINVVKPVHELAESEFDKVMNVNVRGAFLFAKAAFSGLKLSKGVFVTISSINSVFPYPNRIAYCTSKAALEGLTTQLAVEWGEYGISTHCIRLGPLERLMKSTVANASNPSALEGILEAVRKRMPQHALIPAEAVANYILTLGNGSAQWVTGAVINFDGGYTRNIYPLS
jgi:NAD(P)-dependent dehydrogenase (short-subunit alcohol dehydrogenase family)